MTKTIGLLSPGDMGHTVAKVLIASGFEVITCLESRSDRTRGLATAAGIRDVPDYATLVSQAEIILSILVPAQAKSTAEKTAATIALSDAKPIYVDCNAIAPETTTQIGAIIEAAGSSFVDASIIGPPPHKPGTTRFYASGKAVASFMALKNPGFDIIPIGDEIGQASAIKMCYAALTKGTSALASELLTAAHALGVAAALKTEFQQSQAARYESFERGLPGIPTKSRRWVGEMEEIAKTFNDVGLTPKMFQGAADMYRFMGATELADRTPEDPSPPPTLEEMIVKLSTSLK